MFNFSLGMMQETVALKWFVRLNDVLLGCQCRKQEKIHYEGIGKRPCSNWKQFLSRQSLGQINL